MRLFEVATRRHLWGDAFEGAPGNLTAREFADALVRYGPPAIAASTLMMLCVNLYAAAGANASAVARLPDPAAPVKR